MFDSVKANSEPKKPEPPVITAILSFRLNRYKRKLENLIDDIIDEKDNTNSEAKINSEKVVNKAKSKAEKLLKDVDEILSKIKEN